MEDLNNVPSTGTFGNSIGQVNQNFGLVKGAIENVEGRTIRSKGLFPTQAALTAAYPSPKVGDYAYVGSGLPATIYDCVVEGTWHNTGQTGGSETIDLGAYSTTAQMNTAIDNGLQGQVGYTECNTVGSTQRKDVVVNGFKLLASGGALHIKMTNVNTAANATMNISPTSTIVSANTKPLLYNGAQASPTNTWAANEIISVFYDGVQYMAFNSKGGGDDATKSIKGSSGYINLNISIGQTVTTTVSSSPNAVYKEIKVDEGDVILLTTKGGNASRAWGFINSNRVLLDVAPSGITLENEILVVPNGVDKVIIHATKSSSETTIVYDWYYTKSSSIWSHALLALKAKYTKYDNSSSGLSSTDVQEALDEIADKDILKASVVDYVKPYNNDLVNGGAIFDLFKGSMQQTLVSYTSALDQNRQQRWTNVTAFSSSTNGTHVAFEVLNNYDKLRIIGHASRGSFFVFVKSYEIPTSAASFDLCEGQDGRIPVAAGQAEEYDIPGDCHYVIIGITNDGGTSYKPSGVAFYAYNTVNYINKFDDLSINTLRSSLTDSRTTGDVYWGDKINVNSPYRTHYCSHYGIDITGIGKWNGKAQQGLAIYGNYAFLTYDTGYIVIADLTTNTIVANYQMPEGVFGTNNHAGNANFSDIFYDESDPFPLLYVSSYRENCCYVLRVTLSGCTLVQTIYASQDNTETIDTNTYHFYPDNDGRIIVHGDYGYCMGLLPAITNQTAYINISKCVNLGTREVTQGFTIAGAAARNGNLYMNAYTVSSGSKVYSTLLVFNYEQRRLASKFVYPSSIHSWEFEGLAFYNGNQIIVGYYNHNRLMAYTF